MTRHPDAGSHNQTHTKPLHPVQVVWDPDQAALSEDKGYLEQMKAWLQAHALTPFKVLDVAVIEDAASQPWLQAVTRTDDGHDKVRVVVQLKAAPPESP